jgi:hypothetical protein
MNLIEDCKKQGIKKYQIWKASMKLHEKPLSWPTVSRIFDRRVDPQLSSWEKFEEAVRYCLHD